MTRFLTSDLVLQYAQVNDHISSAFSKRSNRKRPEPVHSHTRNASKVCLSSHIIHVMLILLDCCKRAVRCPTKRCKVLYLHFMLPAPHTVRRLFDQGSWLSQCRHDLPGPQVCRGAIPGSGANGGVHHIYLVSRFDLAHCTHITGLTTVHRHQSAGTFGGHQVHHTVCSR